MISKEILLRHGILPSLITDEQIKQFESYLEQLANKSTDTFAKFASECLVALRAPNMSLLEIIAEAKMSLARTSHILESLSPSVKESMLSSFTMTADVEGLRDKFFKATLELEGEMRTLTSLEGRSALLAKSIDFKIITELKLRKAALCEYSGDCALITKYESLIKEADLLLSDKFAEKALKSSAIIKESSNEILKFIEEALLVISAIEGRKYSESDFYTTTRKYQRIIHDITLKIQ